MSLIEWNDEKYSTSIERFDRQHQELFRLLNDLYEAMERGEAQEEVGDTLRELEEYTEYHFGDEEAFMQECRFADNCSECFHDHRKMHAEFAETVSQFRQKHEDGDFISMDVLEFARDWLDAHIAGDDQDQSYGEYFLTEDEASNMDEIVDEMANLSATIEEVAAPPTVSKRRASGQSRRQRPGRKPLARPARGSPSWPTR
jgi:hemerythrin-like metal-binding protein